MPRPVTALIAVGVHLLFSECLLQDPLVQRKIGAQLLQMPRCLSSCVSLSRSSLQRKTAFLETCDLRWIISPGVRDSRCRRTSAICSSAYRHFRIRASSYLRGVRSSPQVCSRTRLRADQVPVLEQLSLLDGRIRRWRPRHAMSLTARELETSVQICTCKYLTPHCTAEMFTWQLASSAELQFAGPRGIRWDSRRRNTSYPPERTTMVKRSIALRALLLGAGLVALPFTFDSASAKVELACAHADGGTCCRKGSDICYPNACSSADCSMPNAYWRSDGKPCDFPIELELY